MTATGFRLPTEAEWEYACRAGTQTPYYNGSTDEDTLGDLAWTADNTCESGSGCGTRPVGGKLANALGFHDMLGNVCEWVIDGFGQYPSVAQTNPTGSSSSFRVGRGGSWVNSAYGSQSSFRWYYSQGERFDYLGFRVARNP
jgi:formylglycine-generating enzyme required for sulfatase activity